MILSKSIDFICVIKINNSLNVLKKKQFLFFSIIVNVGILFLFKYYNFFIESFIDLFPILGLTVSPDSLNIVLPVGLSFYTLQALGYVIDVYQEEVKPTFSIIDYFAFISFFPLILAGPIERASNLLQQLEKQRNFSSSNVVIGLQYILWGLFKKVVIADNCAIYVNTIFSDSGNQSGSTLVLGALFFTFQIYCDFSGYSDMAIGIGKMFNINLIQNFTYPYFSRNIGEFWRRWHISLSSWLFYYIFRPLQMSLRNIRLFGNFLALWITFLLSGIWHGSNWTFIVWGSLHTIYYLPALVFPKIYNHGPVDSQNKYLTWVIDLLNMFVTFTLIVFSWIFFRADNVEHALHYISGIFSNSILSIPHFLGMDSAKTTVLLIFFFLIVEWVQRKKEYALQFSKSSTLKFYSVVLLNSFIIWAIILWGEFGNKTFVYFKF